MTHSNVWERAKIGWYEPIEVDGVQKWDVKLSEEGGFLCERQEDAEIMSMLARIMEKLGIKMDINYLELGGDLPAPKAKT